MTMNISRLSGFTSRDTQKTILNLVWQAREYLSEAERQEQVALGIRAFRCREAGALLDAARFLLERQILPVFHSLTMLTRACSAANAAFENGEIATRYSEALREASATSWDKQRAPQAVSIFKRAAEAGRRETHRALADLCELLPDAIPTDDDEFFDPT